MLSFGSYRNKKYERENEMRDAGNEIWDVRNGKPEIRVFMLISHFSFPKWNFDTKKLNWAPRNGKWDSNEDSRD